MKITHTLLIEIYKSIHHIIPPIMRNFFNLKMNQYNLLSKYLLQLLASNTCRYWTQALLLRKSSLE